MRLAGTPGQETFLKPLRGRCGCRCARRLLGDWHREPRRVAQQCIYAASAVRSFLLEFLANRQRCTDQLQTICQAGQMEEGRNFERGIQCRLRMQRACSVQSSSITVSLASKLNELQQSFVGLDLECTRITLLHWQTGRT